MSLYSLIKAWLTPWWVGHKGVIRIYDGQGRIVFDSSEAVNE